MAIDDKHLDDIAPGDSAVERLRKRNRRIRPWESSRLETPSAGAAEQGGGVAPSGQTTPGGNSPSGLGTQRALHPEGELRISLLEGSQDRGGELPRGLNDLRVINPEGSRPRGPETPMAKKPSGRNARRARSGSRNDYVKAEYPAGKPPLGYSAPGVDNGDRILSVDSDGGFDPRPFLPEPQRSMEWREKGYGEFRIPHRLLEFAHRVTTTRNELLTLNCLMRFSLGFHRIWCEAGYSYISAWTGISDLTNVRKSVRSLLASGIIRKTREHNCASNAGSIYELPVIEAYLSYVKASKSHSDDEKNGSTDPAAKNRDDSPGGISPSGSNTQRVNCTEGSGRNAHSPTGETPSKKEKLNQNLKNSLPQEISPELVSYIEQVKPLAKRGSEIVFLNRLLSEYPPDEIESSLRYVLKFGALGNGMSCHSPLRYLSTSIEQVRVKAIQQDALLRTVSMAGIGNGAVKGDSAGDSLSEEYPEALSEFEQHLSQDDQEYFVAQVTKDNSNAGFTPPMVVLRKLAAIKWVQSRKT